MGFGLGRRKRKLTTIGDGVKPIDTAIMGTSGTRGMVGSGVKPIDTAIMGTSGTRGMVGKRVKPIDRKKKNMFDPFS